MHSILTHYSDLPGDRDLVFRSLCSLLAENPDAVDWIGFGSQEWELLAKIAVDEDVAAMAYYLLKTWPAEYHLADFDPQVYKVFAEHEAVTTVRNALLFNQLNRVLIAFVEHHLPVVLMKGADLARSLYPEPGLRSMSDLDLLVTPERFDEALWFANTLGYHKYLPEASPGLDRLLSHHAHLRRDDPTSTLLELHWTLVASAAFRHAVSMEWFWHNLESCLPWCEKLLSGEQCEVYQLNPTANLLYLTAHQMLQHGGELATLRWLLDLQRLIKYRGDHIDWHALVVQADHFGWNGALRAALEAVQECFGTTLPEGLLSTPQAQTGSYDALVELKAEPASTRILGEWKKLRSLGWPGRVRLFIALVFPSPAYLRWRYRPRPEWIWPLFYAYRWLDMVADGFRTLFHWLSAEN